MNTKTEIDTMLQTIFPDMVQWRRYMHMHPEVSFQEKETSNWITQRLQEMGCKVETDDSGYGLIVRIQGEKPGPTIALRADFDALPIQDEKECEYASTVTGAMHACGHDAHTATMLGIASYYSSIKEELHGERRLIFQPAEEITPGGAVGMIANGVLNDVDAIYGVHLWTPLPYGMVASKGGPFMAAPDEIYIDIKGKGGHGGLPHETVDSIIVGSAMVQALQTIISRNLNPLEPAVISIGSFHAGSTANVIAERCKLVGTVRTFSEEARIRIKERLHAIVKQTAELYGAVAALDYRYGYPTVVNDPIEAERFFKVAPDQFGHAAVQQSPLIMAGEDFSYYLQKVPGCFMFVGAGNEACHAVYPHHHPKFDLDERSMLISAKLMITMAEDFASENKRS
ncbi:putative amidohydrolase YhaA [Paenibacillus baekrokdamisoli]|uniref:Putative amidohydrolase YhaA n=1 Tax=Paenibacillus baekrokdamisoli TaxID=1712516 RepID=A0A3G9IMU7_9BACL|nr:amidohydrolase [Paenibacillus baekrokdamisoli]MBB3067182.1 amidohydrolase [Paenibacillus baekrokdamisoli]BBH19626.1 putative amidohydrolase YhaA [Paenibacillus baekrokdamisoli]